MIPNKHTRLDLAYTRAFGCPELHAVLFQHRADRGGSCPTVAVMIPEAEDMLARAAREARRLKARVLLVCDTGAQAAGARRRMAALLPRHRKVAIERAAAGVWRCDA